MANRYENFEKYDMLKCYILSNENVTDAMNRYFELYPERTQPSRTIFARLEHNLMNYGAFTNVRPKTYALPEYDDQVIDVIGAVAINPNVSCREIQKETGISKSSASRILKKNQYKPYKYHKVQRLHEGDSERRVNFCHWYLNLLEQENEPVNVIWTDEAHISSDGIVNRYNKHYWSEQNPHLVMDNGIQQGRFGFNIWVALSKNGVLAYHVYHESLNAERYLNILREHIPEILENLPLAELRNVYFQQDGAPAHNSRVTIRFLNDHFDRNLISTNGPVRWPARSPDLTPLDFFLWGHLKNVIYKNENNNMEQLLQNTQNALRNINRIYVSNAIRSISRRCRLCIDQNGLHFEQLL